MMLRPLQREKAWNIRPYPCTGIGTFLEPSISRHPAYSTILSRLKSGGKLLDVGCYVGQDLRRLALDEAPSDGLFGNDIVNHWDLGYEFFNDRDRFLASYVESDILFPNKELSKLHGKMDVIFIVHVLHQWDWATQILACKELVRLLKAAPGSLVVGYQGGTKDLAARTKWNKENNQNKFTLHDADTFRRMWDVVGEETGTKWSTEAEMVDELNYRTEETSYLGPDFGLLRFSVTRIN
jgi:SAM-dependent methyltransferase